jgi:hypothetical protein
VDGSYDGAGTGMQAAFDVDAAFSGCADAYGSLNGDLHWTSTADAAGFAGAMSGSLMWTDGTDSCSCDIDLQLNVTFVSVGYTGSVCGYDAKLLLSI